MIIDVSKYIGKPWVYKENDCWSVFKASAKDIFNIDVKEVLIPSSPDFAKNISIFEENANSNDWKKIEKPISGCAVLMRNRRGHPIHIGLHVENNYVLHCDGNINTPGQTKYENIREIKKRYSLLEYYVQNNHSS